MSLEPQIYLEGKTLVLGHGRNHQIIKEIDYSKSIFLDKDPKCSPDIIGDIKTLSLGNNKYDNIIFANSETAILNIPSITSGNPFLRNTIDINVIIKLHSLLTEKGYLYLHPFKQLFEKERRKISMADREKDLIKDLSKYFLYIGTKDFTFGMSPPNKRLVFVKI